MIIEEFREILPGIWYEISTGLPWTTKYKIRKGRGCIETHYDGPLKRLEAKARRYYQVRIEGKSILWHRVIFEHFKGEIPEGMQVDHINNIPDDNRIENLQLLSHKENCRKRRVQSDNTSGFAGVCWDKAKKKWRAQIGINGKPKYLGLFSSPELAYKAYLAAKIKYHGQESIKPLEAQNE